MNARAKDCSSVYTDIARAYAEQVVTGEILLARELARADVFLDLVDCADPIQRLIGQHRLGRPGVRALKSSRLQCAQHCACLSASVYGQPTQMPISEDCPLGQPTNPYGCCSFSTIDMIRSAPLGMMV